VRRVLIAGNWKMNGLRRDGVERARALALRAREASLGAAVVICPPATLLRDVAAVLEGSPIALGAQDCAPQDGGAFTGDIAAPMLVDAGCRFVIVGHSERRLGHGETDALVRAKAEAALHAGLVPIVCLGETSAERDAGHAQAVVERQLAQSLPEQLDGVELALAYEPVWAIGTGLTASREQVAEMHALLRRTLRARRGASSAETVRLLYGGSVKPAIAAELLAIAEVDGLLVGGASLNAESFWTICCAAR